MSRVEAEVLRIMSTCDGPVTPFVAIARACRISAASGDSVVAANALYIALRSLGVRDLDADGLPSEEE
jgi:hypothetical protein